MTSPYTRLELLRFPSGSAWVNLLLAHFPYPVISIFELSETPPFSWILHPAGRFHIKLTSYETLSGSLLRSL